MKAENRKKSRRFYGFEVVNATLEYKVIVIKVIKQRKFQLAFRSIDLSNIFYFDV